MRKAGRSTSEPTNPRPREARLARRLWIHLLLKPRIGTAGAASRRKVDGKRQAGFSERSQSLDSNYLTLRRLEDTGGRSRSEEIPEFVEPRGAWRLHTERAIGRAVCVEGRNWVIIRTTGSIQTNEIAIGSA